LVKKGFTEAGKFGQREDAIIATRRYRLPKLRGLTMRYLHTMIRVTDPDASVRFFQLLGLVETRRMENEAGRFTLIFLAADEDLDGEGKRGNAEIELTYNWPPKDGSPAEAYAGGRNFGHLAYRVDDIYATCQRLMDAGVPINRPPRDGRMAFVRSPDGISVELLQAGESKPAAEPWASMPNIGEW
jgi:lactoylglutathione lyase